MVKIKRALISVSDKAGIEDLAGVLNEFKVQILSTGGTAKKIKALGIPVKDVSEYTGFPEMMNGRVKTLHPKIHGGLLALREDSSHMSEAKKQGILIIGAHIEGMARRVDATDAASIATVIPESKLLLIREDSNEDGYFTKAAEEQGIPIITFKETLDLVDIFKQLFNLEG